MKRAWDPVNDEHVYEPSPRRYWDKVLDEFVEERLPQVPRSFSFNWDSGEATRTYQPMMSEIEQGGSA